jgi:hypothetical protein
MPISGNMGPIMRKEDPQKTHLRSPVPQKDEKGVMILGSRMTREDLLEYRWPAAISSAVCADCRSVGGGGGGW